MIAAESIPLPTDWTTLAFAFVVLLMITKEIWGLFKGKWRQAEDAQTSAQTKALIDLAARIEGLRERVDTRLDGFVERFDRGLKELHDLFAQTDSKLAVALSRIDYLEQEVGRIRSERHKLRNEIASTISKLQMEVRAKEDESGP